MKNLANSLFVTGIGPGSFSLWDAAFLFHPLELFMLDNDVNPQKNPSGGLFVGGENYQSAKKPFEGKFAAVRLMKLTSTVLKRGHFDEKGRLFTKAMQDRRVEGADIPFIPGYSLPRPGALNDR